MSLPEAFTSHMLMLSETKYSWNLISFELNRYRIDWSASELLQYVKFNDVHSKKLFVNAF